MTRILRLILGFGASIVALTALASARAADQAALEEVIVTAQKRKANLQDVAVSITAFSSKDIRDYGFSQPADIMNHIPGVYAKPTVGDQNPVFSIRGVGFNDFTPIQNPGAAVYVNQVVVPYHPMMSFQLLDMERIEVLKGPQGTLYGRNSTAGAINFVSRRPAREREGFVRIDYSSYNTFDIEAAVGGPLSETLSARIAVATYQRTGGHQINRVNNDDDYGSKDRLFGRLMLAWEPSQDFDLLLELHGGRDKSDPVALEHLSSFDAVTFAEPCAPVAAGNRAEGVCINAAGYFDPDDDPYAGDYSVTDGGVDNDAWGLSATANWDLGNAVLTSVTGYDSYKRDQLQDIDASPFVFLDVTFDDETWAFSQELRLASDSEGPVEWIAGAFYSKDSVEAIQDVDATDLVGTRAVISNNQDSDSLALFGHFEWDLAEQWQIVGGLRYTHEKKNWSGGSDFLGVAQVTGTAQVKEDDLSGTVGAKYNPNDDLMVYATFSRSFRSGGFPGGFTLNPSALQPFASETVYAYEAGFKASLMEKRMRLNGAIYYYDWRDLQTQFTEERDGLISLFLGNAGDAEIKGGEIELTWLATGQLELRAGLNVMDTKIAKSPDSRLLGKELANAPSVTANAVARYSVPIGTAILVIQGDASFTDERFFTSDNTPVFRGEDYWLFNARMSYRPEAENWEVAAWIRNAGDKTYRLEGFNQFGFSGDSYHYYGEPRTVGVSLGYDF
jgi:iron complex outermembrane receptor protein